MRRWFFGFVILCCSVNACSSNDSDSVEATDAVAQPTDTAADKSTDAGAAGNDMETADVVETSDDLPATDVSLGDIQDSEDVTTDTSADPGETTDVPETPQGPSMGPPIEVYPLVDNSIGDISAALDDAGRLIVLWAARQTSEDPLELRLSRSDLTVTSFPDQVKIKHFGHSGPVDPDLKVDGKTGSVVSSDHLLHLQKKISNDINFKMNNFMGSWKKR